MRRLLPLLLLATACSGGAGSDEVEVAVTAYPFRWLAERVVGDAGSVVDLTGGAAEPHDLELAPKQVAALREADLLVALEQFQPAVDDAAQDLPDSRRLDVGDAVGVRRESGAVDPHVWLDPERFARLASALGKRLAETTGDDDVRTRADAVASELRALDAQMRAGLGSCARRDVVTSHEAFGYLADRYGLRQVGITGLSPEDEPTPARLAEATRLVRARGVTTIFFESAVDPSVAKTVAAETGARTALLETVEAEPPGGYLAAMRRNLAALRAALGCR